MIGGITKFEVEIDDKVGTSSTVASDSNPSLEFSSAISSCVGGGVVVDRTGAGAGVANAAGTGETSFKYFQEDLAICHSLI